MKNILLLPVLACAISSCESLNTPIYLDGGPPIADTPAQEQTIADVTTTTPPLVNTPIRTNRLPQALPQRPINNPNPTSQLRRTGNFVQPNVLEIPDKEDLKETATSTETAPPPPSINIPLGQ